MKLKARLISFNLAIAVIISTCLMGCLMIGTYKNAKKDGIEKLEMETDIISNEIEKVFDSALHDSKGIVSTLKSMKKSDNTKRELVNELLKNKLAENDNYVSTWVVWEPNGFDGEDLNYVNKLGSDNTGRFIPSWGRNGKKIILENRSNSNIDGNDYYSIPKKTKKSYITDPRTYKLNGKEITTITFSEPIIINDKFYGVAGLDISLEQLSFGNSSVKLFDNEFEMLVNDKGRILAASQQENKIDRQLEESLDDKHLEKIRNGEKFINTVWSNSIGADVYKFYTPINFQGSDLKWSYIKTVPVKELMAKPNDILRIMIIITVIGILIMVGLLYYNNNYVIGEMAILCDVANKLSNHDFTLDENHKSVKLLNRKDEIGEIVKELTAIRANFVKLFRELQDLIGQFSVLLENLTATFQQTTMRSEEISKTIEGLAKAAMDQAQDTENGAIKINDLGNLIKENENYMDEVNGAAINVNNLIDEGLEVIYDLIDKTKESGNAANVIFKAIEQTNMSSEKIQDASKVITSIAKQTNLLALNAAIEAARAGENGRGFAVVADEIRELAEQSTDSTKEIDSVVNELITNSSNMVEKINKVENIVKKQVESVKDTGDKYREISKAINLAQNAIDRMSVSAEKMENRKSNILDIIQSLSAIAEENAASTEEASASTQEQSASIEEIADASEKLSKLNQKLKTIISKFKL